MADSQSTRLYNVFNRITVPSKDTFIDTSTPVNVINAIERGINCTESALISAINENNPLIVDTLLGRHRLIGVDIKPDYVQFMTELDKMSRKTNPAVVFNFLNRNPVLKKVLDTHVVKAKDQNCTLSKDNIVQLLSGYSRQNPNDKATLAGIYNDKDKFIIAMHQYFGTDLVEDNTKYKWHIRGWVTKYKYVDGKQVETDWRDHAITTDDLIAAITDGNYEDDQHIEVDATSRDEEPRVRVPIPENERPLSLKDSIEAYGVTTYEGDQIRAAHAFFTWLGNECRYTDSVSNSLSEARIQKAYLYYFTEVAPRKFKGKTERIIKSVVTLRDLERLYGCAIPVILKNISMDSAKKTISILRWAMPLQLVEKIRAVGNPDLVTIGRIPPSPTPGMFISQDTTSGDDKETPIPEQTTPVEQPTAVVEKAPEVKVVQTTQDNMDKPDENIPRRLVALSAQLARCTNPRKVTKSVTTGHEAKLVSMFKRLHIEELGTKCFYNNEQPYVDFVARRLFGMSNTSNPYRIILAFDGDGGKTFGDVALRMSIDINQVTFTYPEDAYPYGFAVDDVLNDLLQMAEYYSSR